MRLKHFLPVLSIFGVSISAAADAADAVTVTLGGRIKEFFVGADQRALPGEDLNAVGMFNDVRVTLEGKTVLDNGITVRAYTRINAVAREVKDVDEAYVDIVTTFGRLRMGEKAGSNYSIIGDPVPEAFLTDDEEIIGDALQPRNGVTLRDAFTFRRLTGNALGVSVQTTEVFGIKVGVAFHPTITSATGLIDGRLAPHNAIDVSAGYEGDFSGGTYRLAGGYFNVSSRTGFTDGAEAWNLSAGLTYGGWELAGAYMNVMPANGRDERAWTVGGMYGIGPIKLSADYRNAHRRLFTGGTFVEKSDRTTLQVAYKVGPGISFGLAGFYADQKDAAGTNWDSGGALTGVKIDF